MKESDLRVRLVESRCEERLAEVAHSLDSLGFNSETVQARTWQTTALESRPTIVISDSPGMSRDQLLAGFQRNIASPHLLVLAGHNVELDGRLSTAVEEFVVWPCDEHELRIRLRKITALNPGTSFDVAPTVARFADLGMIGRAPAFVDMLNLLCKTARCDAPVLIAGETGTGKELAARAIHRLSCRNAKAFVPVNCGAIPESLVENELFGHRRGAFTDASDNCLGIVEEANGGTLFLDEVGTLGFRAQASILRFLQTHEFRPVGDSRLRKADLRIIAATNSDLDELVREGRFRQDLLFRLNLISVVMPPLRERPGDAELLASYFLNQCRTRYDKPGCRLHPQTLEWIRTNPWPGNVRELENCVHREFLLSERDPILPSFVAADTVEPSNGRSGSSPSDPIVAFKAAKADAIRVFEHEYLERLLRTTRGNVAAAARMSGKERRALGRLIKKHGIDRSQFSSPSYPGR